MPYNNNQASLQSSGPPWGLMLDPGNFFFGLHIDLLTLGGKSFALFLAVVLSGLIGFEREWHGNAAGMRTHILVCLGATLITLASVEIGNGVRGGPHGDPGHIAAQIVSGVGFLGAGTILRDGLSVKGLTTAASIWTTAGIGISLGASPHLEEIAVVATVFVLGTLIVLRRVEILCRFAERFTTLDINVQETDNGPARVLKLITDQGMLVQGVISEAAQLPLATDPNKATVPVRHMQIRVQMPSRRGFDRTQLNTLLLAEKGVVAFHMN